MPQCHNNIYHVIQVFLSNFKKQTAQKVLAVNKPRQEFMLPFHNN